MNKLLSICIGCNKDGKYFESTLNSILQLLRKNNLISKTQICICNDSQEKSGDFLIAQKFKKDFPKIFRLFDNKKNMGIMYTYQFLLYNSKGQFFMPFDSDDIIADFNIIDSLNFLKNNDNYVGSYGIKKLFNDDGEDLGCTGGQSDLFNFGFYCNHNAMILKSEQAMRYGGYYTFFLKQQLKVACDVAMWVNMYIYKDLYFQQQIRCYGRCHENNHSTKNNDLYLKQYSLLFQDLQDAYYKGKYKDSYHLMIICQSIKKDKYNQQQLKQLFLKRMPQKALYSKYVFKYYIDFLEKNGYISQLIPSLLYGAMYNPDLYNFISSYCYNNKYLNNNYCDFSKLFKTSYFKDKNIFEDDWFKKFFINFHNKNNK